MNENENNFESLRRLLALKRHETPPPGYFKNFHGEVMARIRAGEGSSAKRKIIELPWLVRLLSACEAKPAFTGAFAFALCLLLIFGIVYAERPDSMTQPLLTQTMQAAPSGMSLAIASSSDLNAQPAIQPAFISISSTNPVFNAQPASLLFGQPSATAQPLTFPLSGN
jgi:hypothetical protein